MAFVRRIARLHPGVLGALCVVAVAAGFGGWLWLRDCGLVRVERVEVTGIGGPEAPAIRAALTRAAREMTTLHVDRGRLRAAVADYPQVKDVRVVAHPLHRLQVEVVGRPPVATLAAGGERLPIAADGTLLRGRVSAQGLPTLRAPALPAGGRLTGGRAAQGLALVAAAPAATRQLVAQVTVGSEGFQAELRNGPVVILGDDARGRAKWIAAARVLSDPESEGATYIDVRIPERPAAGGFGDQPQTSTGG